MQPGDVVGDRFEIGKLAGRGGMGAVFRAHDRLSGDEVAIKTLLGSSSEVDRFAREAQVLAELRHPGIVRYLAHGAAISGELWLAMEWLEGEDLSQRLSRSPLTAEESVTVLRHAAQALAAAHRKGIIHRDVKPSNLFLHGRSVEGVRVLDFGVARLSGGAAVATRSGTLVGTPAYMAPEQARGLRTIDARADVFALGCVLFECLIGRPPFVGEQVMAVLAKVLFEEVPALRDLRPELPRALEDLLSRMLSKDPAERPMDGEAVARALEAVGALDAESLDLPPRAGGSLTESEQRLVSIVMARDAMSAPADTTASASTMGHEQQSPVLTALRSAVHTLGARVEQILGGSFVAVLTVGGAATDQAARAARCALAMREAVPSAAIALATGRADVAGPWPFGEAIDRAARLLGRRGDSGTRAIRVDEVTAGLLDLRFEIGGDGGGLSLGGERPAIDTTRKLLGRATPCVGRDRELGVLDGIYEECVAEPVARAVLLTGAAGIGKTRLCQEWVRRLRMRDQPPEIWIGRADAIAAGSPFCLLAPAVRRAAGVLDGEIVEVRRQKLRARVARNLSGDSLARVSEFVGEMCGVPFPDDGREQLLAARRDAMLMGDQMRRAFEDWIEAETAAGPLVLLLEDAHWGDLPSVQFVSAVLRHARERPLMVVAVARPDVQTALPALWDDRQLQQLRVGELTRKGSERLIREVLGDRVDTATIGRIVERAAGNAFYLEELVRAVADGADLAAGSTPDTLLAMTQARLDALDPEARRVLRAASVYGQFFWRGAVSSLLGASVPIERVDAWLDALVDAEILLRVSVARFPDERELAFHHAFVRDAAYSMLTPHDRTLGHALAGDWLERAGERDATTLAVHFERGGSMDRAVAQYQRAAFDALEGNDFAAAIDRVERGVACGARAEALGRLRVIQAEAQRWRGATKDAGASAREAVALLPSGGALWNRAIAEAIASAGARGEREDLARLVEAVLAQPLTQNDDQVVTFARAAIRAQQSGHPTLAGALLAELEAAEAILAQCNPATLARVAQARATRSLVSSDLVNYLERTAHAVESFDRAGDRRNACNQRSNLGYALTELGAHGEAENVLRKAVADADRMGLTMVGGYARSNLGLALVRSGASEEGRRLHREAVRASEGKDVRSEGGARCYLAMAEAACGALDAAEREARLAVERLRALPPLLPHAKAMLSDVLLRQGRLAESLATAREAMSALEEAGQVEEGESLVRLVYALALRANGDLDGARSAIVAARDRLYARADKLTTEWWRTSFLTQVEPNARTLALAEEWLSPR